MTGLYVLKVLFIDMTISLGDVFTDFWQVRISEYGSLIILLEIGFKFNSNDIAKTLGRRVVVQRRLVVGMGRDYNNH